MRTLINYHAYDDAWVPDMLAGLTMDEAGVGQVRRRPLWARTPWRASRPSWTGPARRAAAVTDLDAVAHLSFGDYPVREYFWQINQFRAPAGP